MERKKFHLDCKSYDKFLKIKIAPKELGKKISECLTKTFLPYTGSKACSLNFEEPQYSEWSNEKLSFLRAKLKFNFLVKKLKSYRKTRRPYRVWYKIYFEFSK